MAAAVSLSLFLTACEEITRWQTDSTEGGSPESGWEEPIGYEFDLHSTCGERSLIGKFHIMVEDGRVTAVKGLDQSGRSMLASGFRDDIPTLDELIDEVEEARRAGADVVTVEADPVDWHPTLIEIDYYTNGIDDESCYYVTRYSEATNTP